MKTLDEASLSALQEHEAMLKAQLAADIVEESITGTGTPSLASGARIQYKLDSNSEQIQYSVTTGLSCLNLLSG